ncbi:hypothetical protein FRACA_4710002 [Frankia canadensis]|uniref:Uncharacterized protein n=1 Tax=Frankia canadensis TaxID=1836972 RepID=A0A2I2KXW8_9ACTN|nr:hypothetical protein [Frankia canadensis]SNQ50500.1 hypothetical protein FRACA_4710002 [Frankia canadensis]SOU57790.1 hypothetical protein FRACA_4710002 [Frankia canadensis]
MAEESESAQARGWVLSELAALQHALLSSDPFIASVAFTDDTVLVVLRGAEDRRATLPLTASRHDWHRALAGGGMLAVPREGPATGFPPDESSPPRAQYAELLHDLGEQAAGLSYRHHPLTYGSITFDGEHAAAVVVLDRAGQAFRTLLDFARSSGPAVGIPYSIADWIGDGRGTLAADGIREMALDGP